MRLISSQTLATALRSAIRKDLLQTPGHPDGCQYTTPTSQRCVIGAALTRNELDWILGPHPRALGRTPRPNLNDESILDVLARPDCPFAFEDTALAVNLQVAFDTTPCPPDHPDHPNHRSHATGEFLRKARPIFETAGVPF
jgi:hypothetical protein